MVGLLIATVTTLVSGMILAILASLFATLNAEKLWRTNKDLDLNQESSGVNSAIIVFLKAIRIISQKL